MKQRIINYLSLTKKEWNGMVTLVVIIAMVIAAPYVYEHFHKDRLINFKELDKAVAALGAGNKAHQANTFKGDKTSEVKYITNKLKTGETIELNTADSAAFTRVHGIGPSFAKRIVSYRKKLGGFVNKGQLKDIYGLDADKYNEIRDEISFKPVQVKKININNVDFEQLRQFPYFSYKQANAIIQYRAQHGNYQSIDDMKDIALLNSEILIKIAPYLTFKW